MTSIEIRLVSLSQIYQLIMAIDANFNGRLDRVYLRSYLLLVNHWTQNTMAKVVTR